MQLSRGHRVLILQVLETVCKEHVEKVSSQLAVDLISLASRELTTSSVSQWGMTSKEHTLSLHSSMVSTFQSTNWYTRTHVY